MAELKPTSASTRMRSPPPPGGWWSWDRRPAAPPRQAPGRRSAHGGPAQRRAPTFGSGGRGGRRHGPAPARAASAPGRRSTRGGPADNSRCICPDGPAPPAGKQERGDPEVAVNETDERAGLMLHEEQVRADSVLNPEAAAHTTLLRHRAGRAARLLGLGSSRQPRAVADAAGRRAVRPGTLASRLTHHTPPLLRLLRPVLPGLHKDDGDALPHLRVARLSPALPRLARAGLRRARRRDPPPHLPPPPGVRCRCVGVPRQWAHANGLEMVTFHAGFVVFEVVVLIYISIARLARRDP